MPLTGDSTILIPIDISVTNPPSRAILEMFRPIDIVVLGYYPVPKQTAPAHLKEEHGTEANERLESIVSDFSSTGHEVSDVLVFTKNRQDTIDRIADQNGCDAVLVPGDINGDGIERILVPLRGDDNLARIVSLVGDIVQASDATVTLFHSIAEDTNPSQGEFILRGAVDRLTEEGIDRNRVNWQLSEQGDPKREIVESADEYDLVILGETEPSLRERIIGTTLTPIIDEIQKPTIIVRDIE
jgi:nucleotide-binding universal stress UspA family protein